MKHRRAFASVFCLFLILNFSNAFAQHWLQLDDGANHYLLIKPAPGQVGNFTFSLPPVHSNQNILSQGISSPTVSNALLWGGNRNGTGSPDPLILNYGQFGTIDPVTLSLLTNNTARITIDAVGVTRVFGTVDATVNNTAADPVWDVRLIGDEFITGIQKIGGSIWLDGNSATHQIVTDAPFNIGTKNANTVALITSGKQILTIDPLGMTNVNNPTTGNSSLNIDPNSGTTNINDFNGNPIFTVDQNGNNITVNEGSSGEFTINSTSQGFFAANITTTGKRGLEVYCTAQNGADHNTHFIDFNDASGTRGGIQGQSAHDLEADPNYQLNHSLFLAYTILSAALIPLAVAAVLSASDPFEGPLAFITGTIAVVQIAQLAISIEAYQSQDAQIHQNLGVAYTSGNGDYAEYLKRANPADRFYPGDIVGVKNGMISKNTDGAESIYSISLAPIVLGNVPPAGKEELYNKVGFLGQVPVKVLGIVHEGDFILASGLNDGIGIAIAPKDLKPEELPRLVGRSWSSSYLEWVKYINVAVGLNTKMIGEIIANEQSEIDALHAQINKSAWETALLRSRLERLESKIEVVNVRSN